MRPAVHRLPLPLVLGEMAGPAGVDCGDLCPLCPRLATLTASRPRRRRVLASRGVKDSSVMRMGMSGRRVVLADGLIPTDCVAYLGLRQLVFLTKDAKTRVAVLGEVGDLGGEDSATADGWGAADAIGVDLNVADVGVLAHRPAAAAEQLADGLQRRVAQDRLVAVVSPDVEIGVLQVEQDVGRAVTFGVEGRDQRRGGQRPVAVLLSGVLDGLADRKSTRLNSSHVEISYAVFCLKKKKLHTTTRAFWKKFKINK